MLIHLRNQNYEMDYGAELSAAAEIQSDLLRGLKRRPFLIDKVCRSSQNNLVERCLKKSDI